MKFAWIQTEKASYPLTKLCRWLGVTPSGFYAWRQRPASTHAREDRRLKVLVQASFAESKQRYGSPRIHADLIEQDEQVSRKRVIRLMQEDGLKARTRKRFTLTTMSEHDQPVAANLLDRQFEAAAPNQRWVGDTTEFVIGSSGKLYLAVVLDLFSRFVVGWAVSAVNDRHLTIKALEMALKRRCPEIGLLHHSDQGCTYASADYQALLDARGIVCSMSRRGNCHDNAVMESFFSTVKSELADRFDSYGLASCDALAADPPPREAASRMKVGGSRRTAWQTDPTRSSSPACGTPSPRRSPTGSTTPILSSRSSARSTRSTT